MSIIIISILSIKIVDNLYIHANTFWVLDKWIGRAPISARVALVWPPFGKNKSLPSFLPEGTESTAVGSDDKQPCKNHSQNEGYYQGQDKGKDSSSSRDFMQLAYPDDLDNQ